MKKAFELLLIVIIFYGIYSVFDDALPYAFPKLTSFWTIVISFLFSMGLLLLYSRIISGEEKEKMHDRINVLESDIRKKDEEIKNAFKIKKAVEEEAEETIINDAPKTN